MVEIRSEMRGNSKLNMCSSLLLGVLGALALGISSIGCAPIDSTEPEAASRGGEHNENHALDGVSPEEYFRRFPYETGSGGGHYLVSSPVVTTRTGVGDVYGIARLFFVGPYQFVLVLDEGLGEANPGGFQFKEFLSHSEWNGTWRTRGTTLMMGDAAQGEAVRDGQGQAAIQVSLKNGAHALMTYGWDATLLEQARKDLVARGLPAWIYGEWQEKGDRNPARLSLRSNPRSARWEFTKDSAGGILCRIRYESSDYQINGKFADSRLSYDVVMNSVKLQGPEVLSPPACTDFINAEKKRLAAGGNVSLNLVKENDRTLQLNGSAVYEKR